MKDLAVEAGSQDLYQAGTAGKGADYLRSLLPVKTEDDIKVSDLLYDLLAQKRIFLYLAQVRAVADSGNDSPERPYRGSVSGKGLTQPSRLCI
mgnify:CR=1 FL=1